MRQQSRRRKAYLRGGWSCLLMFGLSGIVCSLQAAPAPAPEVAAGAEDPDKPVQALKVEGIAATAATPQQLIEVTLAALREFADSARGYAEQDPERYFGELQAVLAPVLNFDRFARNVMAAPYRKATPEQRARFTDTFKRGLIETYSLALTRLGEGEVVVLPTVQGSEKRRRVKTELRTPSGDVFPVVYALALEKDGRWRIYNIVANGVNLGLTFRNQFKSAWDSNDRDLDKTIDAWAAIVSEREA